ncbi:MAG TPA: endonuclease/exonuclease/phosphatase family protein [Vicinamibacterales bacterium]|jgi:endonuclease/exonuclease/phosphatase family metal-dependent hydrolase
MRLRPLTGAAIAALALSAISVVAAQRGRPPRSFKVATWNIRSGMGVRGFTTTAWNSDTVNCTDRSKPVNAWGVGLPQKELERIKDDPAIVVMALQEAWNCGSPKNVNAVLQFKSPTTEQEGVALLARYGFAAPPRFELLDAKNHRWIEAGRVCLDASCASTLQMFSLHLGGSDAEFLPQVEKVISIVDAGSAPRLFMGDLNLFKIDQWNPRVPCTSPDSPGRVSAIAAIERAGFTDTWKALNGSEGWTGMTSRKGCGSPNGGLFKRIDYIYTKGLKATAISRFAQPAPGADAPSDHAGLIAEFEWPDRK